jgi:hypothetical protein
MVFPRLHSELSGQSVAESGTTADYRDYEAVAQAIRTPPLPSLDTTGTPYIMDFGPFRCEVRRVTISTAAAPNLYDSTSWQQTKAGILIGATVSCVSEGVGNESDFFAVLRANGSSLNLGTDYSGLDICCNLYQPGSTAQTFYLMVMMWFKN